MKKLTALAALAGAGMTGLLVAAPAQAADQPGVTPEGVCAPVRDIAAHLTGAVAKANYPAPLTSHGKIPGQYDLDVTIKDLCALADYPSPLSPHGNGADETPVK
ncbi:hypothetical protein [Streptomyces noursei]